MEVGLIGLPNVGKSTLFNALTNAGAPVASYPFTTIDRNVGIVTVPDDRLEKVASLVGSERMTPATIKFVDIAGLVEGASHGEGLGNQFLGHIREVDLIIHIVRCFTAADVAHVSGEINPVKDIEIVKLELIMADLVTVEKRLEKLTKQAKIGDKEAAADKNELSELKELLQEGKEARGWDNKAKWSDLNLLSSKPVLYIANMGESDLENNDLPVLATVKALAASEGAEVLKVSAKVESELAELPVDEAYDFRQELGLSGSMLDDIVQASYRLLGLISFFTIVGPECRAWGVAMGSTAITAAAKIHTDFAKGFVKAEVIHFKDLLSAGSPHNAREQGHLLVEGKEYVVQDGDIITFKFTS